MRPGREGGTVRVKDGGNAVLQGEGEGFELCGGKRKGQLGKKERKYEKEKRTSLTPKYFISPKMLSPNVPKLSIVAIPSAFIA